MNGLLVNAPGVADSTRQHAAQSRLRGAAVELVVQIDGADECWGGQSKRIQRRATALPDQPFIGVENHMPVRARGLQRRIARGREVIDPGEMRDPRASGFGQSHGVVVGAGVHDEHVVDERTNAGQQPRDRGRFIAGDHDKTAAPAHRGLRLEFEKESGRFGRRFEVDASRAESMHLDAAGRLALAGASRGVAQTADVMLGDFMRVRHEMAAALAALGHRQHAVVDELDQAPGPRHRQQLLQALRLGLLVVELEGLDDHVDLVHLRDLVQVLVDVEEQRGVDVGLPGHEPVRRERQLALGRALARDFLVQAQQALVAQVRFRFQHLQAGAQLDQRHGAFDLLGFGQDGLGTHGGSVSLYGGSFLVATGHQDGGVQARDAVVGGRLAVRGQQAPHQVVVHAEAAQQRVAGSHLHHLRRAQRVQQRRGLFRDAQAEQRLFAVRADQALGQHQVGQVGFANFGKDLLGVHLGGSWSVACCDGMNSEHAAASATSGCYQIQATKPTDGLVRRIPTRCQGRRGGNRDEVAARPAARGLGGGAAKRTACQARPRGTAAALTRGDGRMTGD
ncbi:hypothetical protein Ddc_20531 [Ditylenchus destructor]|nr:hypothetical protein Ddc_20531 [Ditylenchus destructor]